MPLDLTDEERAAVLALVAEEPREAPDLYRALQRSMERRRENSRNGALVIEALRRNGESWPAMERTTGIAQSVLRSWSTPAKGQRP